MKPLINTVLSVFVCAVFAQAAWADCQIDAVSIRGDWGQARFNVEIADDPEERSRGLMSRESLPCSAGMLFVYERPQPASFWMKNTLIPLDMLFIDQTGVVTHIHSNAIPGDLTSIFGGRNVYAVLEINGGLAERYGMTLGSQLRHSIFSGGPAIWPC